MILPAARTSSLLLVAALLLAGCTSGPAALDATVSPLSRHVAITLDQAKMDKLDSAKSPSDALAQIATVRFDYIHHGAAVDPATVTLAYTSPAGVPAEAKLSAFTTATSVKSGDVVRIEPGAKGSPAADVLTGMKVSASGSTLAERVGANHAWMTSEGYPMPIAFAKSGAAAWTLTATGGFDAHLKGLTMSSTEDRCTYGAGSTPSCTPQTRTQSLDSAVAAFHQNFTGTMGAATTMPAEGPRLALSASLHGNEKIDVDVTVSNDGKTESSGIHGALTLEAPRLSMDLQFNPQRELQKVTTQSEVTIDGKLDLTGAAGGAPPMDHPLYHEASGPETTTVQPGRDVEATIVQLLTRAWSLDFAVGDEFTFAFDAPAEAGAPAVHADFVSQVLGTEERKVGSDARQTYKLTDTFAVRMTLPGASPQEFGYDYTYWVDATTFLPVYMQGKVERTFTKAEVSNYLQSFQDLMRSSDGAKTELQLPSEAGLTLALDSTVRLDSDTTDLSTAALLSSGGARMVPMAAAFFVGGFTQAITGGMSGSDGGSSTAYAVPVVAFRDGTRSLTVSQTNPNLPWSDVKAAVDCSAGTPSLSLNGEAVPLTDGAADPVVAGFGTTVQVNDVLAVSCSVTDPGTSATIQLTHIPSHGMLGQGFWTFTY